jgi:membrane protease YdiL (CAAX protease family)
VNEKTIIKIILAYFLFAAIIFLSALIFSGKNIPISLSILLLIPIYLYYKKYSKKAELSKEISETDKGSVLFWIFALFTLALIIRVPSVLLFDFPYEKTPLILLIVFTIITIEKTDISAFGFKSKHILKSLFYGVIFYAVLYGLTLLTYCVIIYLFTNEILVQSYIITFLSWMPFMTVCVGISEEGLFRGYMQTHLQKFCSPNKAILIQAILFGFWHFVWNLSPFDPFGMAQYMLISFLIGLVFGYFYRKTKNLVPLILAHGLWNSSAEGIITSTIVISFLDQFLWILPYAISITVTFLFIKYLIKEI